jgi:2-polyprenyl-3-methyl-5-hydroxy-6-metoxy-1,4-benzoquinol methylase
MTSDASAITEPCPICGEKGQHAYTGTDLLMGLPGEFVYAICTRCATVYQAPIPDAEQIGSFYPEEYEPYRPGKAKERNPLERSVLRTTYGYKHLKEGLPNWLGQIAGTFSYLNSIPYTENGKLLDVGCGGGKFLQSMQHLGWQPEGVEFNESAVKTCRDSGLKVFHGELSSAAFQDNSFDVVTARHVIEHIPTPVEFVDEIYRVLKPGGLMVLMTPNSRALGRNWFGTNWYANDVPRHLFLFAPENLHLLASNAGFQERAMRTSSSPKIILNSWDYLSGNKGTPSKRKKMRRLAARLYVLAAALINRGDEIFCIYQKPR